MTLATEPDAPPAPPGAEARPGTLVRVRGRDWLVLPDPHRDNPLGLVHLRPLGGTDAEETAVHPGVEPLAPATFEPPDPTLPGDHLAGRLLRDAARLSTRAGTGPFRSFGRIGVEPHPYQLVPLLMALRQDPVRLLLADDVGIGKTIEAALIARELLDRGEVRGFCVLCPPHLADQWKRELLEKFHVDAEVVAPGTVRRLERELRHAQSIFERFAFTIVSIDFIKSDRRREDFLRAAPELVIVDEAHGCTLGDARGTARQARHALVKRLGENPERHLVLVTATPHSGKADAFASLLGLLDPELPALLEDDSRRNRERLARHLVQRRRGDILADADFPERESEEVAYRLTPAYAAFFADVLAFTREVVNEDGLERRHQRVRWWAALGLLRAIGSSPAAAASTLRNRAANAGADDPEEADRLGAEAVLDHDPDAGGGLSADDAAPGADYTGAEESETARRLRAFADRADQLAADGEDAKLTTALKQVKKLVADGFNPVVFCRFVPTASHVAERLREALPAAVAVEAVTGLLPPEEREKRIAEMSDSEKRVLVCTDCLSEGVNLQRRFDAAVHYDLAWNPTRLEQREGRVDRFNQASERVRVVTLYGRDNPIDEVVLQVLLRKHRQIRRDLGVSIAAAADGGGVLEAMFEGLLSREAKHEQLPLEGLDDAIAGERDALHGAWASAAEREKASRSRYAQHAIKTEEVAAELDAARAATGDAAAVRRFFREALQRAGAAVEADADPLGSVTARLDPRDTPRGLRDALSLGGGASPPGGLGDGKPFTARFRLVSGEPGEHLPRTHPLVERLAAWTLETALDPAAAPDGRPVARRCGLTVTGAVAERTTLLLVRLRYRLLTRLGHRREHVQLAEEVLPLAFTGPPEELDAGDPFLPEAWTLPLLDATPAGNRAEVLIRQQLDRLMARLPAVEPHLVRVAGRRAAALHDQHARVRQRSGRAGDRGTVTVDPLPPPDLLGAYLLLPP